MARVNKLLKRLLNATLLIAACAYFTPASSQNTLKSAVPKSCDKPVYLTLDTGHMEVAPFMADVLNKHQVKVTFFVANEKTKDGGGSLDNNWGQRFWAARGKEGHEFASHTWDHVYWRSDMRGIEPRFVVRPSQGAFADRSFTWEPKKYCEQIVQARDRIEYFTGKKALPLFRAPGGKTSAKFLAATEACGYKHVGWALAGFLGDELPSESAPNDALLKKALTTIQSGDILVAHLGIWSRKDPWAPAVLEPLIVGLKERGFCFATLREHPSYKAWIAAHGG
jgi:peptidoglycan/xylan/chitin deacetylase (PgdA/CDA1 family)